MSPAAVSFKLKKINCEIVEKKKKKVILFAEINTKYDMNLTVWEGSILDIYQSLKDIYQMKVKRHYYIFMRSK